MPRHETVNEFRISFGVLGEGEPLVWIRGGFGGAESAEDFSEGHVELLSGRFRLIFWDPRAFGSAEDPVDGYSLSTFAADVAESLRRLNVEKAHVVASATGGPIALTLALEHPELVSTLFLINTSTYASGPEREALRQELDLVRATERRAGREAAARRAIQLRHPELKFQDPREFRRRCKTRLDRFDGINRTIAAYLAGGPRLEDRLSELDVPVFIAHGRADQQLPVRCALDLHRAIPGSELHVLPGVGYDLLANEPELMAGLIQDCLSPVLELQTSLQRDFLWGTARESTVRQATYKAYALPA